jgi:broad specificity phosphatase PhoE
LATTLLLLCAAATALSRTGGFPAPDAALDEAGARDAAGCRVPLRFAQSWCSPALAARQTAAAMGLAPQAEPALADLDHGRWSGRYFEAIAAEAPEALAAWLSDPTQGAPGGETLAAAQARVAPWLDAIAAQDSAVCAITHAMTVRAVLAHTLGLPLRPTLAIDLAPLSRTVLSFNGTWRLQLLGGG